MRVSVDGDGVEDTRAASMISKGSYCSSHCLRTVWGQRCCLFTCISLVLAHNRALINICWMHTGENVWIIGLISYSSVQLLSRVWLFVTPWTAACQADLSITNSQSLLKLMSIESVMPSNHLILCRPLLFLPSTFPNIRVFSNESVFHIRQPKYWSFSFSISPSNEYSGLISLRTDWFDLAVKRTLKSLLQHHNWKA